MKNLKPTEKLEHNQCGLFHAGMYGNATGLVGNLETYIINVKDQFPPECGRILEMIESFVDTYNKIEDAEFKRRLDKSNEAKEE